MASSAVIFSDIQDISGRICCTWGQFCLGQYDQTFEYPELTGKVIMTQET